jgi:hypothetical protein
MFCFKVMAAFAAIFFGGSLTKQNNVTSLDRLLV